MKFVEGAARAYTIQQIHEMELHMLKVILVGFAMMMDCLGVVLAACATNEEYVGKLVYDTMGSVPGK
jgi:hypothetical protein